MACKLLNTNKLICVETGAVSQEHSQRTLDVCHFGGDVFRA
jgi:hypothetical protein